MLYLRLIEVKFKQGEDNLTSAENDLRKAIAEDTFNVPQPLFVCLREIGTYTDKMGKEARLEMPALPTTVVQNFGGYHANLVSIDTHCLFEEIPSQGIAEDRVMALASNEDESVPNFHVGKPDGTLFTTNLVGVFHPMGIRRPEINRGYLDLE